MTYAVLLWTQYLNSHLSVRLSAPFYACISNVSLGECHEEIAKAVGTIVGLLKNDDWQIRRTALNAMAALAAVCESFYYCSHMYLMLLKRNALLRLERLWNRWWGGSKMMMMMMCKRPH